MTASGPGRRTHRRWFPVLALVALATMVNYLDRTILGIAAPYLTKELGLTAAAMGLIFSAFSWSYALLQIPGGIFLDRFGTRITYGLALTLWSGATALMGAVSSLAVLVLARIGVGTFEAPCFPANSRILATWFPQHERARANSIYAVGQYAGIAFLSVPLFWITQQFGWRGLFFIVGALGIAFSCSSSREARASAWEPCSSLSIASRDRIGASASRNLRTSRLVAAASIAARPSASPGHGFASSWVTAKSSAPLSDSSVATPRRSSSSPGFPPTWSACAA